MIITKEVELKDFDAWSGAIDTLNALTEHEAKLVEQAIEDLYPEGIDETSLNDLLWFETTWIEEIIGREL